MFDAYTRIFSRMGLKFRAVQADGGSIGGDVSQEFHVLADSGRGCDRLLHRGRLRLQHGDGRDPGAVGTASGRRPPTLAKVATPERAHHRRAQRLSRRRSAAMREDPAWWTGSEGDVVALVLRGDHELNAVKAQKLAGVANPLRMASAERVRQATGSEPGSIGPIGFRGSDLRRSCRRPPRRFRLRREREGRAFHRRQLGPRSARADSRRTSAMCIAGDPSPDGPRDARDRARHRGRPHLPARTALQRGHAGDRARRGRQVRQHVHGLLRHRRDPRGRGRHRAESRCQRHHLAGAARAVQRHPGADQLPEVRAGAAGGRPAVRRSVRGGNRRGARRSRRTAGRQICRCRAHRHTAPIWSWASAASMRESSNIVIGATPSRRR